MVAGAFLPLVAVVLLIATRRRGAYTTEHLALLSNIAHLVTHSFERTLRLGLETADPAETRAQGCSVKYE